MGKDNAQQRHSTFLISEPNDQSNPPQRSRQPCKYRPQKPQPCKERKSSAPSSQFNSPSASQLFDPPKPKTTTNSRQPTSSPASRYKTTEPQRLKISPSPSTFHAVSEIRSRAGKRYASRSAFAYASSSEPPTDGNKSRRYMGD